MYRKILVLNFGSTSTKVALYNDLELFNEETFRHPSDELNKFNNIFNQSDYRKGYVLNFLNNNNINLTDLDCIVSRGGFWKPLPSGVFNITENMIEDIESGDWGIHASGIGSKIAFELGDEYNIPTISTNSPTTDEFQDIARYSGIKDLERTSILHALNQKAIGKKFSEENRLKYEDLNLIIVHLGGGISVTVHKKGKMIDSNDALAGDGPFTPERSGGLPAAKIVNMCFSGKYTKSEIERKLVGEGGLFSYLGTNSGIEVMELIESGDSKAKEVFEAMAYQIAKEIGSMSTVLRGNVDAILFTGGLSHSEFLVHLIRRRIDWISKVYIYPGESEMEALAETAVDYLNGRVKILNYNDY